MQPHGHRQHQGAEGQQDFPGCRFFPAKGQEEAVPFEVWSIDVETTGSPGDLNEVVPVMVAAAEPYITERTDDVVRVKLNGTSKRISAIKDD